MAPSEAVLTEMLKVVQRRKSGDPETSYTARLFSRGIHKIAQKFGEESTEAVISAVAESNERLVRESADVLYHLLMLWAAKGIAPVTVWDELERRFGASGPAIKEQRKKKA